LHIEDNKILKKLRKKSKNEISGNSLSLSTVVKSISIGCSPVEPIPLSPLTDGSNSDSKSTVSAALSITI
jgi:hypothetical protein